MPVTTRSQTKARRLAQEARCQLFKATMVIPKKPDFEFITTTNKYKDIISCLNHGRATTKEQICFKQSSITFQVNFNYSFSYDYSNGLHNSNLFEFKFIKSDNTTITDNEKEILIKLVKQHYK